MVDGGVDGGQVGADPAAEGDEFGDPAAGGPFEPPGQGVAGVGAVEFQGGAEAFFEQVGAVQPGVGFLDPGEFGLLAAGEVFRVLPQRIPGPAQARALPVDSRSTRPPVGVFLMAPDWLRACRHTPRRTSSRASLAQPTTWKGSAHSAACGARSRTGSLIQAAPSADTWVSWAARIWPRASKKARTVPRPRPGAAQISRLLSWSTTMTRYLWPRR